MVHELLRFSVARTIPTTENVHGFPPPFLSVGLVGRRPLLACSHNASPGMRRGARTAKHAYHANPHRSMKYVVPAVCLACLVLSGCARTVPRYENEDLVTIVHNEVSDYTLLVYRTGSGVTHQVLRRKGVCEMVLTETPAGEFLLKERGEAPRKINARMVAAVKNHLHELIYTNTAGLPAGGVELRL